MIRTIKPEAANIRTNAGKAIQSSPVIITNDGYDPPIQRLRTNAGKAIQVTPSQQIIEVVRPELMRVGGKPRGSGSGGAIAYPAPVISPVSISATSLFAAYSVNRRIVSGYNGSLLRGTLFNAGAQSTLDIGQSSGILDTSAIPVNSFFVPTQVFDQSGNNNHLILNRQQSISSQHSLIYLSQKYAIDSNQVSFSLTTNWANASNICIYQEGICAWGRGQDGFGNGWSVSLSINSFFIVSAQPAAYSVGFSATEKALVYADWTNATMGAITLSQAPSSSIPNSSFRSSSVGVLSNFGNGTLFSGWFAEFVVYNNALNGTNRQSLFDTLSA